MAGLNLRGTAGINFGGAMPAPSTGTATVTASAFGPGATLAAGSKTGSLNPGQPFGLAFWVGVGSIVVLAVIRHSLPR